MKKRLFAITLLLVGSLAFSSTAYASRYDDDYYWDEYEDEEYEEDDYWGDDETSYDEGDYYDDDNEILYDADGLPYFENNFGEKEYLYQKTYDDNWFLTSIKNYDGSELTPGWHKAYISEYISHGVYAESVPYTSWYYVLPGGQSLINCWLLDNGMVYHMNELGYTDVGGKIELCYDTRGDVIFNVQTGAFEVLPYTLQGHSPDFAEGNICASYDSFLFVISGGYRAQKQAEWEAEQQKAAQWLAEHPRKYTDDQAFSAALAYAGIVMQESGKYGTVTGYGIIMYPDIYTGANYSVQLKIKTDHMIDLATVILDRDTLGYIKTLR